MMSRKPIPLSTAKDVKAHADELYRMGTIDTKLGALEVYPKLYETKIEPHDAHLTRSVLSNMCQCRYDVGEIEQSIKDARAVISSAPEQGTALSSTLTIKAHYRLARGLFSLNEYDEAEKELEFLIEKCGVPLQDGMRKEIQELQTKINCMRTRHPKPIFAPMKEEKKPQSVKENDQPQALSPGPEKTLFLYRCLFSSTPGSDGQQVYDLQILLPTAFAKPQSSLRASDAEYAQFTQLMLPVFAEAQRYLRRDGHVTCIGCGSRFEGEGGNLTYRHAPTLWGYKRFVRDCVVAVCGMECDKKVERKWSKEALKKPSRSQ